MMHQDFDNGNETGTIFSMISVICWIINLGLADVHATVSILCGIVAFISGSISIYKNTKTKKK